MLVARQREKEAKARAMLPLALLSVSQDGVRRVDRLSELVSEWVDSSVIRKYSSHTRRS